MSLSATGWILTQFTEERNTYVRNNSDVERYWAQFAYISVIPFAIVECLISQAFRCIAFCAGQDLHHEYQYLAAWANHSAYSLLWTIDCIFMNLCSWRLYASENAYRNFINHFSFAAFRARFNQRNFQPVITLEPRPVTDDVKKVLENYEVGENAMKYSTLFESLYEMIPEPLSTEIANFPNEISTLMEDWENRDKIVRDVRAITEKESPTELNRRFIKLLIYTYKTLSDRNRADELLNFKNQFGGVFRGCINRMTTEMERIFFQFAAQPLFEKIRAEMVQTYQNADANGAGSTFFKLIYKMIPKPTKGEIKGLISYVTARTQTQMGADRLIAFFAIFSDRYQLLTRAEQNFIKMLVYTYRAILNHHDDTIRAVQETDFIRTLLQLDFSNNELDRQKNETLFFKYGATELLEKAHLERLLYDFTQLRRDISDFVMQRVLNHYDIATNINYFADKEHKAFGLPPPPLSAVDHAYENVVSKECGGAIIAGFKKCYLSPHTIYAEFHEIVWPLHPEDKNFKRFKPDDFLNELKKKYFAKERAVIRTACQQPKEVVHIIFDYMDAPKSHLDPRFQLPTEAYNEDGTGFNPQDIADFLLEMHFLKKKQGEEQT